MESYSDPAGVTQHAAGIASRLLKCATLGALLLFGAQQTARNNYPQLTHGPCWTLLDVAHFCLLLLPVGLGVARGCLTLGTGHLADSVRVTSLVDATCDLAVALSSVAMLAIAWKRWRRCLPPSGFVCTLLGFLSTAAILDAVRDSTFLRDSQEISAVSDYFSKGILVVTYLMAVCIAGNFLGAGIRDQIISRKSSVQTYQGFLDEDSVSPFARIACLCLLPTFKEVGKKKKSKLPIPHLRRGVRCKRLVHALTSRMRQRATLLPPAAAQPTGYVASILAVDCVQLYQCVYALPLPFFGVLTLPLLFWMLSERAGVVPAMCCAAWAFVTLLAPLALLYAQNRFWDVQIHARDERLKSMTDLLSNIRVVKMYAWEDVMQENVLRSRKVELRSLLAINMLNAVLDALCSSCSVVTTIILFSTMSIFEPERALNPQLSFSCISLLYITDLTASNLPIAFRNISKAAVALRRISGFCTTEEYGEEKVSQVNDCFSQKGAVSLEKCTLAWSRSTQKSAEPQLRNVTLSVEPGSLVGIVGFVGSGKSSLLSAILGDMQCLEGSVAHTGRIAYVPQLPNVHNMTIRDNILYGRPMHPSNYERVLRRCQLMNDLNKIPAGDAAEVGEKGTNLSGGQKQRISLARAAYSNSDVYLLDDPLSALDPVVANSIFRDVLGPSSLLRNKTRIMVCNQGKYLGHMDKIVFVHEKKATVYASVDDLLKDPASPQNFRTALKQRLMSSTAAENTALDQDEENDAAGRITEEELAESTKTGLQLLLALVRCSQWPAVAGVAVLAAAAVANGMQQLWMKSWTDASAADPDGAAAARWYWVGGLRPPARRLKGASLQSETYIAPKRSATLWRPLISPGFRGEKGMAAAPAEGDYRR
ncbi:hypothetical protein HPB49_025293 [Dermacentor silvarum]|uniref:Uncharacterized protein n=1 Tax=Dermacentor silvarum TaxID=543639 RepID=A0ACB8DSA8_DERSI|nr:hypothetical protein HPB49_025293 [Dermacentor silvarum]